MIRYVEVDGFRTLSEFKFTLTPGLNLLVGPNGGGKTTVMLFFSFLRDLYSNGLQTAISRMGGAGSVFRKIGKDQFQQTIDVLIAGSYDLECVKDITQRSIDSIAEFGRYVYFRYSFSIGLSDDREDVFITAQELCLRRSAKEVKLPERIGKWDAVLRRRLDEMGKETSECTILAKDFKKRFQLPTYREATEKGIADVIDEYVDQNESILHVARAFRIDLRLAINQELSKGVFYNPQPDQIREPEDSAKTPGIRPDGSGLYSSLLALKPRKRQSKRPPIRQPVSAIPFQRNVSLERLTTTIQLAFPHLKTIQVFNDNFDNQIRVRVTLNDLSGTQLPLSALSDGTLKWMSLATALLTTRLILGVEEPENFLHPNVQREVLQLLREQVSDAAFVLVSTHSQTVLDAARPEEIVVVYFDGERTLARRIRNPQRIAELIRETGFGLGFFYQTGALQDA